MPYDHKFTEIKTLQMELVKSRAEIKKLNRELSLANKCLEELGADGGAALGEHSDLLKFIRLLLENSPNVVIIFSADGRTQYCTERFLKLCRIPGFAIIKGLGYRELLAPYTDPALLMHFGDIFEQIAHGREPVDVEAVIDFELNNSPRNYSIRVTPMFGEGGALTGSMAYFTDMTELRASKREAERANEAKSNFLATVSHEIRTPMNAIIGLASMLKNTGLNETQAEYLSGIENASCMLLDIINDILDFSQISAGKLEIVQDHFDLAEILGQLRDIYKMRCMDKGLEFICDFSDGLPRAVIGDGRRVRQILSNVLNNAVKYTEHGSITFSADFGRDDMIRFTVEDTGAGMRREAMSRLFKAFEQLDSVRNKKMAGTGLGLAITKMLCNMMFGTIEAHSEPGNGSTFIINLPLKSGDEGMPYEIGSNLLNFSAPGAKVLLVDDIGINLQVAEFILEGFGVKPDLAESGMAALDLAEKNHYDLILMDHMMPEMDGIETAERIRALGGEAAMTPIVALTANAAHDSADMFMANGFDGFIPKPIDSAAIAKALIRWLPKDLIAKPAGDADAGAVTSRSAV
jgi:signal transduction histidine kinase/ActR/RegA family two-component response regulator